eukprot:g46482.t1
MHLNPSSDHGYTRAKGEREGIKGPSLLYWTERNPLPFFSHSNQIRGDLILWLSPLVATVMGGAGRGKDMANITGQSLGKDISTILAGSKDNKRSTREAACRRKKRRRLNDLDSDSTLEDDESEEEFKISESSEEEFEISDRDSEADPASNDDEGFEVRRGRHRKYVEPMRRSWRLRGRQVKRYSDEDEEDEEEHG